MPVAFAVAAKSINTTTSTCVLSFTVTPGACIIAGISTHNNTTISAVYANGTPFTFLGRHKHGSHSMAAALYGLLNAPSGTVSVSCQTVGGVAPVMHMMAAAYTGVGSFGDYKQGSGSAVANVALSFSTSTTGRVVCFGSGLNTLTAMNATTRLSDVAHLATNWCDTAGPAASYSLSYSANASIQNLLFVGLNLVAASETTGTLARTNANDTPTAAGASTVTGTFARTNSADTATAAGTSTVIGTVARTHSADTAAASGKSTIIGTLARTNANDTLVATGSPIASGASARTNANDTVAASGSSLVSGALARTNANDTGSATGTPIISGALAKTNADDIAAASGDPPVIVGTAAPTNANDTLVASGFSDTIPLSVPVPEDRGAGSGKGRREYQRVSEDFWLARERHLRRHLEPEREPVPDTKPAPGPGPKSENELKPEPVASAPKFVAQRDNLLASASTAKTVTELRTATARVIALANDLEEQQHNEQLAVTFFLLDL